MKRCFISIDLPEDVKKEVKKIQDKLPEFRGKFTELENLHLTLKFLGEADGETIKEVKSRLNGIKFSPLELKITELGVFSERFVRIVWLKLVGADALQKKIDETLSDMFGAEPRFMSHLTIARVKWIKDKNDFLKKLGEIVIKPIEFVADSFNLKESVLKPEGPEYSVLEIYK